VSDIIDHNTYTGYIYCRELLIPGVNFEVTFNRNPDDFFLQYNAPPGSYKVRIENLQLHLREITLKEDIFTRHQKIFALSDVPYHHTASLTKTFNLDVGVSSHYMSYVFGDRMPNQIAVAILAQNTYEGHR
jgi:hypothetical protein